MESLSDMSLRRDWVRVWGVRLGLILCATGATAQTPTAQAPSALSETYRNWVVRCQTVEEQDRRCWMVQTLQTGNGGNRILQVELAIAEGATRLVFLTPLGIVLPAGVSLSVDGNALETLPFNTCVNAGCLAEIEPSAELLRQLRRGTTLTAAFRPNRGDSSVPLPVSLAGFSAALDRLTTLSAP